MIDNSITARELLKKTGVQEVLDFNGITEVAINQPYVIWFERGEGWECMDAPLCSYQACYDLAVALSVYSSNSIPVDFNNPFCSVVLPDGERGQVLVPPACENETVSFTFRKPSLTRFSLADYNKSGRLSFGSFLTNRDERTNLQSELVCLKEESKIEEFFKLAVTSNLNILLVGGTGSGKTTMMKALVDLYPKNKRIFTIEDVHELSLPLHPNHVHLFYKNGGLSPKLIIEACMRMKPDHVILAELRGDEAWSYIEMLNTGHCGSVTTIHANDCISALGRLTSLVKQSPVGKTLDYDFILKTVTASIDVVCFFQDTHLKDIYFNPDKKNSVMRTLYEN